MEITNEHRLSVVEELSKSNERRIQKLEKRQEDLEELTLTVKSLAIKEENIESTVKEIKDDVKQLNEKPAKRWEGLVTTIISVAVGALIGFIFTRLGM